MSSDSIHDHLIIGGGISGLGLAHASVRAGLRTLVLERQPQVGGCMHSHAFPEAAGFWTELGAHTCYNSYGHLVDILTDLGLTSALAPKAKLPFRMLGSEGPRSIMSRLHPLELLLSLPRLATAKRDEANVAQYYGRVLGQRNYQDLFAPAFDALICQPAGEFPADLLFRRKPRRKEIPRSYSLPQGLGGIPAAIASQPGLETRVGQGAAQVSRSGDLFQVRTENGAILEARHLSLALPPDEAARLLAGSYPALAELLGHIQMARIESVAVVVPRDALAWPPLAGVIAPNDAFYSLVSRDYLEHPQYRGFTFHFRPDGRDLAWRLERIAQVLGLPRARILAVHHKINRLPALRLGHRELTQRLDAHLAGQPLGLTGNYFFGVSIEDCLTRSAGEFLRLFGD